MISEAEELLGFKPSLLTLVNCAKLAFKKKVGLDRNYGLWRPAWFAG